MTTTRRRRRTRSKTPKTTTTTTGPGLGLGQGQGPSPDRVRDRNPGQGRDRVQGARGPDRALWDLGRGQGRGALARGHVQDREAGRAQLRGQGRLRRRRTDRRRMCTTTLGTNEYLTDIQAGRGFSFIIPYLPRRCRRCLLPVLYLPRIKMRILRIINTLKYWNVNLSSI